MPNTRAALAPDAPLTLVTLGSAALRVGVGDSAWTLFDLGKPLALITYLACAPDRSVPREHLIDLLWGDVEPEAAKHALRQTLWYIRKRLGDRTLISGGDVLTIAALDSDRDRFLDAVTSGSADDVVRLYTGEFFPSFAAPGGAEFERWADLERQRLRAFFWRNADTLVRRWMSSGKLRDAQLLARRVRDTDALREAGWRLLFETLIAAGDTVGGALEADVFDRLVSSEGLEPEASTRAMLRAVRQTPLAAGDISPDRPSLFAELVGREQEFSQLLGSWEAARAGRATHVHVVAPAGLGKTRLLADVSARLRATRTRTVAVRASLGARDIPFGLASDLAEALATLPGASGISTGSARALVGLNPALSASYPAATPDAAGDSADALRRRTVAVRELVLAVAEEQSVAIFIDDVQWADARSRQMVASIIGALETVRVLIVTASRPAADALSSAERSQTLRLAPLNVAGVSALVASIAALPAEPWAERFATELHSATGGSPLLVLETLQLMMDGGLLVRADSGWQSPRPGQLVTALNAGGAVRQRVERLDRTERWVLTLLAVGALPLSADVLTAATGQPGEEVANALGGLERRGLATRHGDMWMPSHDEIAASTVEVASPEARVAAARSLGRVILDRQSGDMRELRHAGVLLVQAGDHDSLGVAFARFARLARLAGDRQPNRALATDFLGERSTPALIGRIVGSLSLTHRLGMYSGRRQAAVAAMIALVPLGGLVNAFVGNRPPPDVELVVGPVDADSNATLYKVPIRAADLVTGAVIEVDAEGPVWRVRADPTVGELIRSPASNTWIIDRVASDSGGLELFELSDDGSTSRRLTEARGDDQGPSFSPDGQWVAYWTARWDTLSRYDIVVQNLRTGAVRRLTSSDDSDLAPYWSPDGSRIAFTRFYWNTRHREVCVTDIEGSSVQCFKHDSGDMSTIGGWYDAQHVLAVSSKRDRQALMRIDVDSGTIDTATVVAAPYIRVSPDARWVACPCRDLRFSPSAMLLFPLDEPNRVVELDVKGLRGGLRLTWTWINSRHANRWVDSLTIDEGLGAPIAGVPHHLAAKGYSITGQPVAIGRVRWRSLDTTAATIDEHGVLLAKRAGDVPVEATLSGWRTARRTVSVQPRRVDVVLQEDWSRGISARWVGFGDPLPVTSTSADGTPALLNNGEGSFVSGVYTRNRYAVRAGLSIDTWLSVPITRQQWQIVTVALDGTLDERGLSQWGHRYGNVPRRGTPTSMCELTYPAGGEGITFGDSIGATGASTPVTARAPRALRAGAWMHVRAQIFPDGRCGVAVNGVPLSVTGPRAISDSTVWAFIGGNSVDSKALVAGLTVRTGVPDDIDWSRTGGPLPAMPPPRFAHLAMRTVAASRQDSVRRGN